MLLTSDCCFCLSAAPIIYYRVMRRVSVAGMQLDMIVVYVFELVDHLVSWIISILVEFLALYSL